MHGYQLHLDRATYKFTRKNTHTSMDIQLMKCALHIGIEEGMNQLSSVLEQEYV